MAISLGRTLVRRVVAFLLVAILIDWLVAHMDVFGAGDTEKLSLTTSAPSSVPSVVLAARIGTADGVASPAVTLDPVKGRPGTPIHVTGRGYSPCAGEGEACPSVEVLWDNSEKIGTAVLNSNGTFSADVHVPQAATPRNHQVAGKVMRPAADPTHNYDHNDDSYIAENGDRKKLTESAEATFTVLPSPVLALSPKEGRRGTVFRVAGSGYSPCTNECPPVEILWDTNHRIGTAAISPQGTFSADVVVPQTAALGDHLVIGEFGTESAQGTFSVTPSPALILNPKEGRGGTVFRVAGSGYSPCTNECPPVDIVWDTNQRIGAAKISSQGTFLTDVVVPQTAAPGNHLVTGEFRAESARAAFFVLPSPATTTPANPPTDPPNPPSPPDPPLPPNLANPPIPPNPSNPANPPSPTSPPNPVNPATPPSPPNAVNSATPPSPPNPPTPPNPQIPPSLTNPPAPPNPQLSPSGHVERAYLATQVSSPIDVFSNPILPFQLLLSGLLVLLLLAVAFPAILFESTFEKNREEIKGWFCWMPRPRRLNLPSLPSWVHLPIFGLVAAVLLLMAVIPKIRLDGATLAQAFGYMLAVPLVAVVLEMPGGLYLRRKFPDSAGRKQGKRRETQWRVLPSALAVAGFLALLSRLAEFSPPYVYGLIAVYLGADRALKNLNEKEKSEERGRGTLIGMLSLFAASVISWLAWIPLDRAFHNGLSGFGWLLLDAFLATFFLLGLEAAVFGMMPLTFLKGEEVRRWKPAVWITVFLIIAFVFLNVQLIGGTGVAVDPGMEGTIVAKMIKAAMLFIVFGIISVAFWGYFHPRVRQWFSRLVYQFSRLAHR